MILFPFRNFYYDCPEGKLYKENVQKMYEKILPSDSSAKMFADTIFRIFDSDCDGYINFTVKVWLSTLTVNILKCEKVKPYLLPGGDFTKITLHIQSKN